MLGYRTRKFRYNWQDRGACWTIAETRSAARTFPTLGTRQECLLVFVEEEAGHRSPSQPSRQIFFFDGVPMGNAGHKIRINLLWPGKKEKVWPLNEVNMGDLLTYIMRRRG